MRGGGVNFLSIHVKVEQTQITCKEDTHHCSIVCLLHVPDCAFCTLLYFPCFYEFKGMLNHWIWSEDDTFYYKISVVCLTSWFLFKSVYDDWSLNQSGTLLLVYSLAFSFVLSCCLVCVLWQKRLHPSQTYIPLPVFFNIRKTEWNHEAFDIHSFSKVYMHLVHWIERFFFRS